MHIVLNVSERVKKNDEDLSNHVSKNMIINDLCNEDIVNPIVPSDEILKYITKNKESSIHNDNWKSWISKILCFMKDTKLLNIYIVFSFELLR